MKSSASALACISWGASRSSRRISLPSAVPPGSRTARNGTPAAARSLVRRRICVDFPAPSGPSKTISTPAGMSAQGDDGARAALLDPVEDPVIHLHHELVEVLLRDRGALVDRARLGAAKQRIELLLHFHRRLFPTLDHLLRVGADLLHLAAQRGCLAITRSRVIVNLHRLNL